MKNPMLSEPPKKLPEWKLSQRNKTLVATAKSQMQGNKEVVMNLLDYDEITHNQHLYECGLQFLARLEEPHLEDLLQRSRPFWNWYRNEWSMVQDSFIRLAVQLSSVSVHTHRAMYEREMKHFCVKSNAIATSFNTFLKCSKEI